MRTTLIAPTYKRPDVCNRLIESVPSWINIIIVDLSNSENLLQKENVRIVKSEPVPYTNAVNYGKGMCDILFPETELLLITDDDVYFTEDTIIDDWVFSKMKIQDTGLVAITRIINSIKRENILIESPFVYKGGGYLIRKEVFEEIGGYTHNSSVDEWDICIKTYIMGYKNYRTKSSYAFHKQGSKGGYKESFTDKNFIGNGVSDIEKYLDFESVTLRSGLPYFSGKKTKVNKLGKTVHLENNRKLNNDKRNHGSRGN